MSASATQVTEGRGGQLGVNSASLSAQGRREQTHQRENEAQGVECPLGRLQPSEQLGDPRECSNPDVRRLVRALPTFKSDCPSGQWATRVRENRCKVDILHRDARVVATH